jgi:predicted phage terminase large subunit-like protein
VKLHAKQQEAMRLLSGPQTHTLLVGGSRSGKTFLAVRAICVRAIAAPGARQAILRFRFNAAKQSIAMDTLPKVMKLCFPGVPFKWNDQMGYFTIGESQVWVGGLDDKERTEKILGLEFCTMYLNEASQIPWNSVELVRTRLAQVIMTKVEGAEPKRLRLMMLYDCNPPNKGHWTYIYFIQRRDPNSKLPLSDQRDEAWIQMNPDDNRENLPEEYIEKTLGGMSAKQQKRFRFGEFADATPNALFTDETIDKWRCLNGEMPDMQRIVVAVDPSGSGDVDNADNDAIGIVVVGLGTDGNAYVLEDVTCKAGPAVWGNIAGTAYDRHQADLIVGETNYGGAMVQQVIQTARPRTPFKAVTASRGKVVRAEPFSALYESGKIRHSGYFRELEDELTAFSTNGYTGANSPNRADALIWALTEIFPGMVNPRKLPAKTAPVQYSQAGWMA